MVDRLDARSTVEDVLSGLDLGGRRFLVTGVSSGIGREVARALAAHGASVTGTARQSARAEEATATIRAAAQSAGGRFAVVDLDLASLASVRSCAEGLLDDGGHFDAIVANAGILGVPYGTTRDGFELHLGTNYLGHFALLHRIAPLIRTGGRLVTTSSQAHRSADVDLEDPNFARTSYDPWIAYARSKTANALFAAAFDRRHRDRSVRAASVEPGTSATHIDREFSEAEKRDLFAKVAKAREDAGLPPFLMKSVEQAAATPVWAAIVGDPEKFGGRYCENCSVADVDDSPNPFADGVRSYAIDPAHADRLWATSEEWIGAS